MSSRHFGTSATADVTLVTTAETVVATLSGLSTSLKGQLIEFSGWATITTGTGTTAVTTRVREDSLAGTVVGEVTTDSAFAAAGGTETHSVDVVHSAPGEFSGKTYVLTIQQTGATGNGSVLQSSLRAVVR